MMSEDDKEFWLVMGFGIFMTVICLISLWLLFVKL